MSMYYFGKSAVGTVGMVRRWNERRRAGRDKRFLQVWGEIVAGLTHCGETSEDRTGERDSSMSDV